LHPQRVSSLTIADSRVRALQPTNYPRDWPDSERAMRKLKELGLAVPEDETDSGLWLLEQLASPKWQQARHELKGSPLLIPFGGWNDGQRTAERWLELLRTTAARKELTSLAGLTLNQLSKINHPILAVYGECSTVLPSFRGLRDLLLHCKSAIIPGAGHFYPLTRPKLFVSIISRFLKELERKDRRRHERYPLTFSVDLRETGSARFLAATVNVSKRGLLIKASRKLEIGSVVEVTKTPNKDGQSIVVRGRVVRMVTRESASDYRFGIELCSEDPEYDAWENLFSTKISDTQVVSP
ncbi:MAG: PilZ domain-containing protein, partial [Thermodesulfobacteriota bacterium]